MLEVGQADNAMNAVGRAHGVRNIVPLEPEDTLAPPRQMPTGLGAHRAHARNNDIELSQTSCLRMIRKRCYKFRAWTDLGVSSPSRGYAKANLEGAELIHFNAETSIDKGETPTDAGGGGLEKRRGITRHGPL